MSLMSPFKLKIPQAKKCKIFSDAQTKVCLKLRQTKNNKKKIFFVPLALKKIKTAACEQVRVAVNSIWMQNSCKNEKYCFTSIKWDQQIMLTRC